MYEISLPASVSSVGAGLDFIEKTLKKFKIKQKVVFEAMLVSEESMVRIINSAIDGSDINISLKSHLGIVNINIMARGSKMDFNDFNSDLDMLNLGGVNEDEIRSVLIEAFSDKIVYSYRGDYNCVQIKVGAKEKVFAFRTTMAFLIAIVFSIIAGLLIPFEIQNKIVQSVLLPAQNIFLSCLKLVTAPAVFFSMVAFVARFTSLSHIGKVNEKIIVGYIITSIVGVLIAAFVFKIFKLIPVVDRAMNISLIDDIEYNSIKGMIVSVFPDNIITPFLETNSLQLLVIAIVSGAALGHTGKYSEFLRSTMEALNKFFSECVNVVANFIPLGVFFVTVLMIFSYGYRSLSLTALITIMTFAGFLLMLVVYMLLVASSGLNPFKFLNKYLPTLKKTLDTGSSLSAIPDTMRCCKNKLGISSKVYSFSIPFGAISNLDGNCIYLSVAALVLAKISGIDMTGGEKIAILIMVILLSVGAPITPGSAVLALTMMISHMGVPIQIICIILGINALIEMLLSACNVLGDVAATLFVAKTENLMDTDIYNS